MKVLQKDPKRFFVVVGGRVLHPFTQKAAHPPTSTASSTRSALTVRPAVMIFLIFLTLLFTRGHTQAGSGNPYCDPTLADLMCNTLPRFPNNCILYTHSLSPTFPSLLSLTLSAIVYNGPEGNPSLPWVIGKNDVVVLNAGSYSMGTSLPPFPPSPSPSPSPLPLPPSSHLLIISQKQETECDMVFYQYQQSTSSKMLLSSLITQAPMR